MRPNTSNAISPYDLIKPETDVNCDANKISLEKFARSRAVFFVCLSVLTLTVACKIPVSNFDRITAIIKLYDVRHYFHIYNVTIITSAMYLNSLDCLSYYTEVRCPML